MLTNKIKVAPLGDRILVEVAANKVTSSGLFISSENTKHLREGTVLGVGPEEKEIKVNDKVLFSQYSGSELKQDNDDIKILIIRKDDIFGKRTDSE